jgi:hypothetical protein
VLSPNCNFDSAMAMAERIRQAVADQRVLFRNSLIQTTSSVGVSCVTMPFDGEPQQFLERADQALYRAKSSGRDAVWFWDSAQNAPMPAPVDRAVREETAPIAPGPAPEPARAPAHSKSRLAPERTAAPIAEPNLAEEPSAHPAVAAWPGPKQPAEKPIAPAAERATAAPFTSIAQPALTAATALSAPPSKPTASSADSETAPSPVPAVAAMAAEGPPPAPPSTRTTSLRDAAPAASPPAHSRRFFGFGCSTTSTLASQGRREGPPPPPPPPPSGRATNSAAANS